jgi:hypothetical protein
MMAPKYERARMLEAAIQAAVHELDDPIDRIEVGGGRVTAWAGSKSMAVRYGYVNATDGSGIPMPGAGHWRAVVDDDAASGDQGSRKDGWFSRFRAGKRGA